MRDLFEKVPVFVILLVIVSVVRAALRAVKGAKPGAGGTAGNEGDSDEQRRVREIQERIRRIAAERRGDLPTAPTSAPPVPRSLQVPPGLKPIDPFGGPEKGGAGGELLRRLRVPTPPPVPVPTPSAARAAAVEREAQLRDALRTREEQRFLALRHAEQVKAAARATEESEAGLLHTARAKLLDDLNDPGSVRRAWVLREVLGPPVGLR
jgi:hypothetical protein